MNELLLTFYGDDFTGSTDVTEALTFNGVPAVLFLAPPTPQTIRERFPQARAVGVAGVSRSMTPAQMDSELPPIFEALRALGAPLFHYKICSTFDSSPTIGSIGHAIEIGIRVFGAEVVPMIVGAPILKRYLAFGNLFATVHDETFRLDRHPTMRKHPITPMDESDLRLHLGKQTGRKIALIDLLTLAHGSDAVQERFAALRAQGAEIILFDTLDQNHLLTIGGAIWAQTGGAPIVSASSSGLEYALASYWQYSGTVTRPPVPRSIGKTEKIVVMSGSAAPGTAAQLTWAMDNGFEPLRLDTAALVDADTAPAERERAIQEGLRGLASGKNVLLYATHGPDDPAIKATKARMTRLNLDPLTVGARLGEQQGIILRAILEESRLRRVIVTGGDTCGHVARQLDIFALETVLPVAPGAPLCRAHSHLSQFDGIEISLKAGQVGKPDYFRSILHGETPA